jgi:hypothetical protein
LPLSLKAGSLCSNPISDTNYFTNPTTSVKGAVYTLTGTCLFTKSLPYPTLRNGHPGWVEQNPDDWISRINQIFAEVKQALPTSHIAALGLTSQVNTHVFVDAAGQPLMHAIVWQDQRCVEAATRLNQSISNDLRSKCWGKEFKPSPPLKPIETIVGPAVTDVIPWACPITVGIMDAALYGSGVSAHGDAFQVAGTEENYISSNSLPLVSRTKNKTKKNNDVDANKLLENRQANPQPDNGQEPVSTSPQI